MSDVPKHWPFEDAPNTATITVNQILEGTQWIHLVSHDADDGGWQFIGNESSTENDAKVVGLSNIFEIDPSIAALSDLPLGWYAWRDQPDAEWQRKPQ